MIEKLSDEQLRERILFLEKMERMGLDSTPEELSALRELIALRAERAKLEAALRVIETPPTHSPEIGDWIKRVDEHRDIAKRALAQPAESGATDEEVCIHGIPVHQDCFACEGP